MYDKKTPTIVLEDVNVLTLTKRYKDYQQLYQCAGAIQEVKVRGTFIDEKGDIAFYAHDFHTVNMQRSKSVWLCVQTGIHEWAMMKPCENRIDAVSFTSYTIL